MKKPGGELNGLPDSPAMLVVSAKTCVPRQGARIYPRTRLIDQLSDLLDKGNLWINGPPGAGKMVLMADFAGKATMPVVWYEMDLLDGDLVTFFSSFPGAFNFLFKESSPTPPPLSCCLKICWHYQFSPDDFFGNYLRK